MTDAAVKIDTQTKIELVRIAADLAIAALGGNGNIPLINSVFEKCHESVLKRFNVELEQENS
ncbi:MAG: hypothetical protein WBI40_09465 [Methylococcaceae bacterium]